MPQHPTSPAADPGATVRESARAVATDVTALAGQITEDPAGASLRTDDQLAEEMAEVAAMLRALPGRPAPMSGHDRALLGALRTTHASGEDLGETLARALARLAAELGGSAAVLASRPGNWEAGHVAALLAGTVGPGDEALGGYA